MCVCVWERERGEDHLARERESRNKSKGLERGGVHILKLK